MLAVVLRGSKMLVRPEGEVPRLDEIEPIITVVESYEYDDIVVVTSFLGDPEGWLWVPITEVQFSSPELLESIGEAVLCGGSG